VILHVSKARSSHGYFEGREVALSTRSISGAKLVALFILDLMAYTAFGKSVTCPPVARPTPCIVGGNKPSSASVLRP
ncbi:hypothetical protein HID58_042629, partial [Brassica napus]